MEKGSDDSEQVHAVAIAEQAKALLEHPESVQLLQRYTTRLDPDHTLEVRISGHTGETELEDSRYIYLFQEDEAWTCLFSININSLGKEKPSGVLDNVFYLAEATAYAQGDEADLLRHSLAAMQAYEHSQQFDEGSIQLLQESFLKQITKGSTHIIKQVNRFFSDGTSVWITSDEIEGSLEYIWPSEYQAPALKITLENDNWEHAIVLEQSRNGLLETYARHPDEFEARAGYLDPENVVRNDEGKIVVLTTDIKDEAAVVTAERASGIRGLHAEQLQVIDDYLSKLVS